MVTTGWLLPISKASNTASANSSRNHIRARMVNGSLQKLLQQELLGISHSLSFLPTTSRHKQQAQAHCRQDHVLQICFHYFFIPNNLLRN